MAAVEEDLVPEPGVEEVQDGVFGPADVEVDGQPVFFDLPGRRRRRRFGVDEAEVVPARAGPLRHRVGFAFEPGAVVGRGVEPLGGCVVERRVGRALRFEVLHLGESDGKLIDRRRAA